MSQTQADSRKTYGQSQILQEASNYPSVRQINQVEDFTQSNIQDMNQT